MYFHLHCDFQFLPPGPPYSCTGTSACTAPHLPCCWGGSSIWGALAQGMQWYWNSLLFSGHRKFGYQFAYADGRENSPSSENSVPQRMRGDVCLPLATKLTKGHFSRKKFLLHQTKLEQQCLLLRLSAISLLPFSVIS